MDNYKLREGPYQKYLFKNKSNKYYLISLKMKKGNK